MKLSMPQHPDGSPVRPLLESTCHQVSLMGSDAATAATYFGAAANLLCSENPELDECAISWEQADQALEDLVKRARKIQRVCRQMAGDYPDRPPA